MDDLLGLYSQASDWARTKVEAASTQLDAKTPCEQWDARTLLNHVLDTQRYFSETARGREASPPGPNPPELVGDDPVGAFDAARNETKAAFGEPGVIEKTGPSLGIAFSDLLIHGWDLAKASGEDATMPDGLAAAAYEIIHGKFSDDQRNGIFKPEIKVGDDASPQEKLLAYTGRTAS
ncbi:MAG: TIGR03086 family protein [Actinobacteria bacterium]|nr:TIGR03086 family protein [Actinomycetota bacterium]